MGEETFPNRNPNSTESNNTSPKWERKYKEYLGSALGKEITRRFMERHLGSPKAQGSSSDFNIEDLKYGSTAIHDYKIELTLSGNIEKEAEQLFKAINATKLLDRLDKENPVDLLNELKTGMQSIIDNSNKPEFKDKLWKAIEVKIVIEDILNAA